MALAVEIEEPKVKAKPRPRPRRLKCSVQNYDWGITGEQSTVARLYSHNSGSEVEVGRRYAELWMGTHESGPSFVVEDGVEKGDGLTLKSWIRENPNVLGEKVVAKWGTDLPFLFKVLSVAKALSIQAHPDKSLAGLLHKTQPGVYKDSNHKPEMAVAITEFKALCGFVGIEELKEVFVNVPEIVELVGEEDANKVIRDQSKDMKVKDILKPIFTKIMSASGDVISNLVCKLRRRLSSANEVGKLTEKERLALELEKQYPADVGVLSSFLFNYVKLKPGQALYLGPNEPHAYISGECIECMATSDNVVRAGLTPKFRDVPTLCSMLTYKQGSPEILEGLHLNPYVTRYIPPFDEFEVDSLSLPAGESVVFPAVPGPSLFVVLGGEGYILSEFLKEKDAILVGDVLFVPAETQIRLTGGVSGTLQLYRAGVNGRFFD